MSGSGRRHCPPVNCGPPARPGIAYDSHFQCGDEAERGEVSGLADGAVEGVAGALDGLGGVEVGHCGGALVEGIQGDVGPEEAFGAGERPEVLVGGGDVRLAVGLRDATAGAGDLGGEEAGPVEVEEGTEVVAEEAVDLGDERVGDVAERAFGWRTMLPFLESTSALSLECRGRDLVKVPSEAC